MQINLAKKNLFANFLFCLLLTLAIPSIYPSLRLMFLVPFLVIACYQKTLSRTLWIALGCGLILDLLASYTRLGFYAINYCITLGLIYPQRKNFFADSMSTLPIMTFLFSSISAFIVAIMLYVLEMKNIFSPSWIFADMIALPAADAVFSFLVFILPSYILGKPQRRGSDYFLQQ